MNNKSEKGDVSMIGNYIRGRAYPHRSAEGIEKGRAEERFSNARKMKAKGVDSAIISDITGLTQEEIEKL